MILRAYIFHLRARNLSPATVKATEEYLRPFIALHDPLTTTRRDIETYLSDMSERCKPSTVWTAWRHLKGFFKWLHAEGDINVDPMVVVITQTPRSEASVYHNKKIQHEVCTTGVLMFDNIPGGTTYPIRFVHNRTITTATQLRSGDKIYVEMGRFKVRHGRAGTEFIVKDFSLISTC